MIYSDNGFTDHDAIERDDYNSSRHADDVQEQRREFMRERTEHEIRKNWIQILQEIYDNEIEYQFGLRDVLKELNSHRQTTIVIRKSDKIESSIQSSCERATSTELLIQYLTTNHDNNNI
jgi:hypothetical protein